VNTDFPRVGSFVGSYDYTVFPEIQNGQVTAGNLMPSGMTTTDYELGVTACTLPVVDKGGKFKAWSISGASVSGANTIEDARSSVIKANGYADWTFRFGFKANTSTSVIEVNAPYKADLNLFYEYAIIPPLAIPICLSNAGGLSTGYIQFDSATGTKLQIHLNGAETWFTAVDRNWVHVNIRYKTND